MSRPLHLGQDKQLRPLQDYNISLNIFVLRLLLKFYLFTIILCYMYLFILHKMDPFFTSESV